MQVSKRKDSSLLEGPPYYNKDLSDDAKHKANINNVALFQPKKERKVSPSGASFKPSDISKCRLRLGKVMFSRCMDNVILVVIILFSVLTFVSLSLGDSSEAYSSPIEIVELVLLVIFLVEMLLKLYAVGWRFLRNIWNDFDLAVVILSLILASYTLAEGPQGLGLLKFSAVLRLLRLTVAFRKFGDFKRIKAKLQTRKVDEFQVDLVAERVVSILQTLLLEPWLATNSDLHKSVSWCIDAISSNRLGEAIVSFGASEQTKEMELLSLVNQFSTVPTTNSANIIRRRTSRPSKEMKLIPVESELTTDVKQCFNTVDFNEFDIFELKKLTNGNELFTLMHLLFNRRRLFDQVKISDEKFKGLISRIQHGYNNVPYHNSTHAADVTQTLHYFLTTVGAGDIIPCLPLETAACYLAAAVHDFEHPGVNNTYLVNTQSELAVRYNDKSVLENHHISSSFSISLNEEYDIYTDLTNADYVRMRSLMIEMVLSTDIVQHFSLVSQFKTKFSTGKTIAQEEKNLCFQLLIHAADISNPSKPWGLCSRWTELVMEEFWNQGDRERQQGLPIGYLMDRYTTNVGKSQVGFIDVIVAPTFEALRVQFPAMIENCNNLKENKEKWEKRIPKYDEDLKALNNPAPSPN